MSSGSDVAGNASGGAVEIKSIKSIKFGGDEKLWREWSRKVLAYFGQQGWQNAVLDEKKATDQEKNRALNFLVMSLTGKAFAFVQDATSAATVWAELSEEFEPNDDVDVFDIQEAFSKCLLKNEKENPIFWFKRLEHINYRLCSIDKSHGKSDDDVKVHIMCNLPEREYSELITTIRKSVKAMPLKELKKDIKAHWRRIVREDQDEKVSAKENQEQVLNNTSTYQKNPTKPSNKRFTGKCSYCGKTGHKRSQCFKRKKDEQKKQQSNKNVLKCWNCGRTGHLSSECKFPPKNDESDDMFVGNVISSDVQARSYAEVVKGVEAVPVKEEKREVDSDIGTLFAVESVDDEETVSDESWNESVNLEKSNKNSIDETYRLKTQLKRCNGNVFPCDIKPGDVKRLKADLSPEMIEIDDPKSNPKLSLKNHWSTFRDTMEDFVVKMEDNSDVSIEIEKMNKVMNLIHELTYLNIKPLSRSKKGSGSCDDLNCDDKILCSLNEIVSDSPDLGDFSEETVNVIRSRKYVERWLLDSGSTIHLTNNKSNLRNITNASTNVTVGTGTSVRAFIKGDLILKQLESDDVMVLKEVLYVPTFNQNILSISKLLKEGYVVKGDKDCMELTVGNRTIKTNTIDDQNMFYLNVERLQSNVSKNKNENVKLNVSMNEKRSNEKRLNENYKITRGVKCVTSIENKSKRNRKIRNVNLSKMKNKRMIASENNYKMWKNKQFINNNVTEKNDVKELNSKSNNNFDKSIRRSETVKELETGSVHKSKPRKYVAEMDINQAHDRFGHMNEELLRRTCKIAKIRLTGKMRDCLGCLESKARAKGVSKMSKKRAEKPCERVFIDTSGPYPRSLGGNRYWFKIVDDASRKNWNYFMKNKHEVSSRVEHFLSVMKGRGIAVKYIRCDNAGEHGSELRKLCIKNNIKLEYTSPHTPQQNGVVERAFATDTRRLHAMMIQSRLNKAICNKLWPMGIKMLERITNMSPNSQNPGRKTPNEYFPDEEEKLYKHLKEFGRIGFVTIRDKIKGKMKSRSKRCVMVGYAENHTDDTYIMYNPATGKVILSRDIRWARYERPNIKDGLGIFRNREEIIDVDEYEVDYDHKLPYEDEDKDESSDDGDDKFSDSGGILNVENIDPINDVDEIEVADNATPIIESENDDSDESDEDVRPRRVTRSMLTIKYREKSRRENMKTKRALRKTSS